MILIDDLSLIQQLADAADSVSMRYFSAGGVVAQEKPDGTPVTEADREVEQALRVQLASARPQDSFIGEESGNHGTAARRWVIDPIDGTANFAAGRSEWSSLIAVEADGEVLTGMITAPALERRWWASRAAGAWTSSCPGGVLGARQSLEVSGTKTLDEATVAMWPVAAHVPARRLVSATKLISRCADGGPLSKWSRVCQGAMLVAAGEVDVFLHLTAGPWDIAAAVPIVEEAGGRFSDMHGVRSITSGAAVFTNGLLHEDVLAHLGRHGY
ncbi:MULTISPECIES: inositol monophosphatase family protein [unclassified Streptomyces]|uniref:inositol monophosphatase family protein n=1 Tax=unclassified Streptomyces TaxID=2593676 RepID=UPI00136E9354|nr:MULTISPECIES: inositol monophosphatase family protein [unclassified Streptomyces]MYS19586.1 inositol monophosphatase [Streptomyces sp. SID4948]